MSRNSPSRGSPGSGSPLSRRNRGTVIVEQNLLSVKSESQKIDEQRKSTGSFNTDSSKSHVSLLQRKSTGSPVHSEGRNSFGFQSSPDSSSLTILSSPPVSHLSVDHRYTCSTDSLSQLSPPDSVRSSVSSLLDASSSSISNIAQVTSTEDRLLEELKRQITSGAARIQQLEKQVAEIPSLTTKVDELERERGKLANDLLDSEEVVQSMKQRLSVVHEQNNQLVKLANSSGEGSSELLRNRNALVASLTQIKKLQQRVDVIPGLKTQIRVLTDENVALKEHELEVSKKFPEQLPNGVTRDTYQKLVEENSKLTLANQKLVEDLQAADEKLGVVSGSLENIKKRMDKFESTRSIVVPLQQKIKRIEKEKDELYQEYVEVKFHQQPSVDIDTAQLQNELLTLKKKNSHLQTKIEQVMMDSRQEREKLILKLFELETLTISTQKYDIERKILENKPLQSDESPVFGFSHTPKARRKSLDEELADLPAESKIQMLKLQQIKMHSEQSRTMLQSLLAERDGLEKKVEELSALAEQKSVADLEKSIKDRDYKLEHARETIVQLEQQVAASSRTGTQSSIEQKNIELSAEIQRLTEVQVNYEELVSTQKQAKQYIEEHELLVQSLQKAKDDKHRAERRYKDGKLRLKTVAKELTGSVELIQKYQSECMRLQDQLDVVEGDLKLVRSESATYKAQLEVVNTEALVTNGQGDAKDSVDFEGVGKTEYDKVCEDRDSLKKSIEALGKTISEQQEHLWKVKSELESARVEGEEKLDIARREAERATEELKSSKTKMQIEVDVCSKLKIELEASSATIAELKEQVSVSSKSGADSDKTLSELKLQCADLSSQILALGEEKDSLTTHCEKLKEQMDIVRAEFERREKEMESKLSTSDLQCQKLTSQLSAERGKMQTQCDSLTADFDGKKKELESKISVLNVQCDDLIYQMAVLRTEKEKISYQSEKFKVQQEVIRTELKSEIAKLQEKMSIQSQTLSACQADKLALAIKLEQQSPSKNSTGSNENRQVLELEALVTSLHDEIEGYNATIMSLKRHIQDTESREIEHEKLKQNFTRLEQAFGTSSHDNKALFGILQQTLKELPNYSSEASRSLQDENVRLEQEVSVLSQWNDKHRTEIEELENAIERIEDEKQQLLHEVQSRSKHAQENEQLKRELKEVEREVGNLRKQARQDIGEEYQVKLQTHSDMLAVYTEHNASLQRQVKQVIGQVHELGGTLDRDKPVSPPPMPDVALSLSRGDEMRSRSLSDFESENRMLKQRISTMEKELENLQGMGSDFRRRSSSLRAMFSVPVGPINQELQVKVPPEFLLPCSLLADHITEKNSLEDQNAVSWLDGIRGEWFAVMAQRTVTSACVQSYIATLSRLSNRLMEVIVNLQDEKGNTALHYAVANSNFPVVRLFVQLRCCKASLFNKAGYNPLMLAAACNVEVGDHVDTMGHLVSRGGLDTTASIDKRTALMLASGSGSEELVKLFLDKGADVNKRDKDGSTPLMFAAQSGHIHIVGLLLSHRNIAINTKDNDGNTASDIAKDAGFTDISLMITGQQSKTKQKW